MVARCSVVVVAVVVGGNWLWPVRIALRWFCFVSFGSIGLGSGPGVASGYGCGCVIVVELDVLVFWYEW